MRKRLKSGRPGLLYVGAELQIPGPRSRAQVPHCQGQFGLAARRAQRTPTPQVPVAEVSPSAERAAAVFSPWPSQRDAMCAGHSPCPSYEDGCEEAAGQGPKALSFLCPGLPAVNHSCIRTVDLARVEARSCPCLQLSGSCSKSSLLYIKGSALVRSILGSRKFLDPQVSRGNDDQCFKH